MWSPRDEGDGLDSGGDGPGRGLAERGDGDDGPEDTGPSQAVHHRESDRQRQDAGVREGELRGRGREPAEGILVPAALPRDGHWGSARSVLRDEGLGYAWLFSRGAGCDLTDVSNSSFVGEGNLFVNSFSKNIQ